MHTKEIFLHAIGESNVGRRRKEWKKYELGEKKGTIPMIVEHKAVTANPF